METITLDQGLELRQISKDCFASVQLPWTWHGSKVVPGGLLMALAAAAAYESVTPDFSIDTLSAHFLNGPSPASLVELRVDRISDGGRFCTRIVRLEQSGRLMVHVTCSFVRTGLMKGPSMEHRVRRKTECVVEEITLDDLEVGRGREGPFMKFQRLGVFYTASGSKPENPQPGQMTYTSAAQISPPITNNTNRMHALGIIALSDYHILDCPPTLHNLTLGAPAINDYARTPTYPNFERSTSLNHRIQFHVHEGFRADEVVYIEAESPWAQGRRAEIGSRIFGRDGGLLASCVQEAYYVLKEEDRRRRGEKGAGKL